MINNNFIVFFDIGDGLVKRRYEDGKIEIHSTPELMFAMKNLQKINNELDSLKQQMELIDRELSRIKQQLKNG